MPSSRITQLQRAAITTTRAKEAAAGTVHLEFDSGSSPLAQVTQNSSGLLPLEWNKWKWELAKIRIPNKVINALEEQRQRQIKILNVST
ncbi:hypothetical protein ACLKA6_005113 [Drosophila palustris]